MNELLGKTILVTGASSGIGREIAILASCKGATVVITGRNQERLTDTFANLAKDKGQSHQQILADLGVDEQIELLASNTMPIDGLVCCSGINDKTPIKHISREKIDKMYNANVFGPMLLVKELIKKKKVNNAASILFISSISSIYAAVSNSLYASSKGAVNSLVKILALELALKKIRVNSIMPGMIRTNMVKAYGLSEVEMEDVVNSYPLGRIGEPEDIAKAAAFFLSDDSSWITGANLVVDGGLTLR
jgi:NAD(P)-dependent dehydrogenase (short-subunit alcohol dehydrogenase family)